MTTMEMPEPSERELVLNPEIDPRRDEATPDEAREPLRDQLSLGGPVYRRVTVDSIDDIELKRFLKQEAADSDFYLVHLTCTLRPEEGEPFKEAYVGIDLTTDVSNQMPPIAWSLQPDVLYDAVEISRTVSLGPSLKFQGIGIDTSVGRETKLQRKDVFLRAMEELESTPSWELFRTSSTPLQGLQRFHMVVRAAKGSITKGTAAVEAKVERKRFGLMKYTASLPDAPAPVSFELKGDD